MNGKYTVCVLLVCSVLRTTIATSIHDEFDAMIKRMDQMEQENARLVNTVTRVEQQNVQLVYRMTQVEQENAHLKSGFRDLEEENNKQRILDRQLVKDNKQIRDAVEKQEMVLRNFMSNGTVPETVANRRRRSFPEVPCAFTAVLDHNVEHASIDQTVVFNSIILNDGNAYNKNTGVFTVPTDGVYLFYLAFASGYDPQVLWMHIVVDGVAKVAGVADT